MMINTRWLRGDECKEKNKNLKQGQKEELKKEKNIERQEEY